MKTNVIIALGSNMGDPEANLRVAIENLQSLFDSPLRCSSFWRSEPVDMIADAGMFVNAAVVGETSLSAGNLLQALQEIERKMGRAPGESLVGGLHASRTIDLDIITYGDREINEKGLVVPHPRAHKRLFVLLPLAEIVPGLSLAGLTLEKLIESAPRMDLRPVLPPPAPGLPSPPRVDL